MTFQSPIGSGSLLLPTVTGVYNTTPPDSSTTDSARSVFETVTVTGAGLAPLAGGSGGGGTFGTFSVSPAVLNSRLGIQRAQQLGAGVKPLAQPLERRAIAQRRQRRAFHHVLGNVFRERARDVLGGDLIRDNRVARSRLGQGGQRRGVGLPGGWKLPGLLKRGHGLARDHAGPAVDLAGREAGAIQPDLQIEPG